jgi:hypothetical protein
MREKRSKTKKPGIEPGFFSGSLGSVALFGQIATHAAAQCTTQASADGGTCLAAQAIANHRTARRTDTATDSRFGAAAFACCNSTAGCARYASTNRCTCAAAHFLTDHITQRATQTTTKRGSTITGSHRTLSNQKAQNQSRQCQTHNENLKKGGETERPEIECFRGGKVQTQTRNNLVIGDGWTAFMEKVL